MMWGSIVKSFFIPIINLKKSQKGRIHQAISPPPLIFPVAKSRDRWQIQGWIKLKELIIKRFFKKQSNKNNRNDKFLIYFSISRLNGIAKVVEFYTLLLSELSVRNWRHFSCFATTSKVLFFLSLCPNPQFCSDFFCSDNGRVLFKFLWDFCFSFIKIMDASW